MTALAMLRPGGLELTRRALELCGAQPGALLLDVGCGLGASAGFAAAELGLVAAGVDPCEALLRRGRMARPQLRLVRGRAEQLPVADGCADVILAECSLSLVADRAAALGEIRRALRPGGTLAMSDVYLRCGDHAAELRGLLSPIAHGLARSQPEIAAELVDQGLFVTLWEDHSATLRDFACGPEVAPAPWQWEPAPGADPFEVALAVARGRAGYFLLLARRV